MVDIKSIAPDAMDKSESDEKEHVWRVLGYGNPGTGKTHFGFTMPEPIVCVDTESKAHAITDKFDKEIYLFQVDNYTEASEALDQALDLLEAIRKDDGRVGTLMIDSMSNMWDWAQQRHMELAYPGREKGEVNFNSALSGGQSDWQTIKRLHNERFRERMINSDYNLYWTATSSEDYNAILSGQPDPPAKPNGEKDNQYRATELIHFIEGVDGKPAANLKKTAITKWRFGLLYYPTFDAMKEIITSIADAEKSDEPKTIGDLKDSFTQDVDIFDGDPDIIYQNKED
jgi:hypothetical protein